MLKQAYQKPEIRDASDNIIQKGAYGKKTAFTSATNDGVLDYINNNLEAMMSLITGEMIYADTSAGFPSAGDTSKLYIAKDTGKMYTWDGKEYVERTGAINGVGITGITINSSNNNMVFAMTDGTTHTVTVPQVQAAIDAATSASASAAAASDSASSAASSATTAQTNQTVQDLGTLTANTTINGSLGETVKAVIGANLTLAINANAASGKVRRLLLVLSNGGKYVITWPTTITWAENYPPVLSYQTDMIELVTVNNGASWYGRVVSRNMGAVVFSRASQAYLDGRLYAANVPRFTVGGLLIETGTTNLYDGNGVYSIANSGTTLNVTQIADDVPSSAGKYYRVDGNAEKFVRDPSVKNSGWWCGIERGMGTTMSLKAGDVLAFSAWIKAPVGKALSFSNNLNKDGWAGSLIGADVNVITSTDGQWHRYNALLKLKEDYDGDLIVDMFVYFYSRETLTYYIGGWQIEKLPYNTSYIDAGATRASETLTVPAAVASSDDITIEMTVVTPSAITDTNRTLFNGYSAKHRFLWYIPSEGTQIGITYMDTSHSEKYIMGMSPNIIDGSSHKIALTHQQSTGIIKMYVDGALTGSGVMSSLDTSLTGDYIIGSQYGNYHWNHPIRDIRISNTVHTADKIASDASLTTLPVDDDTTCYMSLDRTLFAEGSAM